MSKLGKLPEPPGPEEPAPPLQAGFPVMGVGGKLPTVGNETFFGPGKGLELPQLPLKAQQLLMALPGAPWKRNSWFNFLRILWLLPFPLLSAISIVGGCCAFQELSSWQIPGFLFSMWAVEAPGWVRAALPGSQWDPIPLKSTL